MFESIINKDKNNNKQKELFENADQGYHLVKMTDQSTGVTIIEKTNDQWCFIGGNENITSEQIVKIYKYIKPLSKEDPLKLNIQT